MPIVGAMAARITSTEAVGRTGALDQLLAPVTGGANNRVRHIVVMGEAGVGKSRLLADAAELAGVAGIRVLTGGCVSMGDSVLPFAPYAEVIRDLMAQDGSSQTRGMAGWGARDLARLVPALATDELQDAADPVSQLRLFEAVLDLLRRVASRGPLMVQLEDLHWADGGTLAATTFLFRSIRDEPISIICTVRSDEIGSAHGLRDWLAEASRSERVQRLDLERLSVDETQALVRNITGEDISSIAVEEIHRRSDGNPYFIEELLASGVDTGRYLPTSLREVLLARVDRLDGGSQHLLAVAAVGGREIDHEVLVAVDGRSQRDLADDLNRLVQTGLLSPTASPARDAYMFRHALLQEAVLSSMIAPERRRLHGEYAAVLEARGDAASKDVRLLISLAQHWRESHDERGLQASIRAGDAAMETYAFAAASAEFDHALELWPDAATRPEELDHVDLLARSSLAASYAGDYRHAVALAREATSELEEGGSRRTELGLLQARALWNYGDWTSSIKVFEEALEAAPPPPDVARIKALAGLGQGYMLLGWLARSRTLCEEAISLARAFGARDLEGHALNTLSICLAGLGESDAAVEAIDTALTVATEVRNPEDVGRALINRTDVLNWVGRTREALEFVREGVAVMADLGLESGMGQPLRYNGVMCAYLVGEWGEAADLLTEADRMSTVDAGIDAYRAEYALNFLVGIGAPEVTSTWGRAREMRSRQPLAVTSTSPFTAAIEAACYEGRHDEAVEIGQACLDLLRQIDGQWRIHEVVRAMAWPLAELGRTARASHDDDASRSTGERLDGLMEKMRLARSTYKPSGPAWQVLLAHDAQVGAERHRLDGVDAADEWGAVAERWRQVERPFFEAYAQWRASQAADLAGHHDAAKEPLRRSHGIARRLGARPLLTELDRTARKLRVRLGPDATEARSADLQAPYGLTPREQEVLRLVAAGRTNTQIAAALFISPSTAGVHVSNIMSKLGVSTRTEAASVAIRDGLTSVDG
jgi:DNA-binding CsgD family transcriptional regulator